MGKMTSRTNPYNSLILSRELTWLERYICFGLQASYFSPWTVSSCMLSLVLLFVVGFFLFIFQFWTFQGVLKLNEMKGVSLKALQHVVLLNEHVGNLVCVMCQWWKMFVCSRGKDCFAVFLIAVTFANVYLSWYWFNKCLLATPVK